MRRAIQERAAWVCAGIVLLLGLGWAWVRNPYHEERVSAQPFAQVPTYPLEARQSVAQTLMFEAPNLAAIEFWAALSAPLPNNTPLTLTLSLERVGVSDDSPILAIRSLNGLRPNEPLRFDLPSSPQKGALYRATITSVPDAPLSLWASRGEAYSGGDLETGAREKGDLSFTLYYRYTLRQALGEAFTNLYRTLPHLAVLFLLLFGPGMALLALLWPAKKMDPALDLGLALGGGLAFWPLLFLWVTACHLSLRPWAIWLVMGLSVTVGVWAFLKRRQKGQWQFAWNPPTDLTLLGLLGMGLLLRFIQARHILVPNWVDGFHHTVIAQLMADLGQVPQDGGSFVEVIRFHYHFGFHAVSAAFAMAARLEPYRAVLLYGQVLNALAALSAYILAREVAQSRWAGVIAAGITSCLAYMPAYYTSWGRYTQLAGLVLLAPLWVLSERLYEHPRLDRENCRYIALTALLIAGLGVTHYRVLIFYIFYILLRLAVALISRQFKLSLALTGLLALASLMFVAPWVGRFLPVVWEVVPEVYGGWRMPVEDPLPKVLLTFGNTPFLLGLSAVGALWGMMRRQKGVLLLAAWCGLLVLSANPQVLGLNKAWLLTNTPVVISFWLPCGALCGWLVADVGALIKQFLSRRVPSISWRTWLAAGVGVMFLALSARGGWSMVNIVNPATVLVTQEDMRAMAWAREHIPQGAKFLINTTPWMNEVRRGSDGGWWLPILAGHRATLPCILYTQGPSAYRERILAFAGAVENAADVRSAAFHALLKESGITHIFVGSLGGRLSFAELDGTPWLETIYAHGAVRIYALRN